jgi:3-dehydroquinate synthase
MNSILIGKGLLSSPEVWGSLVNDRSVCIISDPVIASHYLPSLKSALEQAGARNIINLLIPAGEEHKTLKTAEKIWDFLIQTSCDRHTLLIALGGGVVGDLVGFCGACYMRGIAVIQCPTSLLAQVDAAIGGKTGVNHSQGKNLIGAFHMPEKVIVDIQTLQTLPERELRSAIAELIKYGLIADPAFFTSRIIEIEYCLAR